MLGQGVHRFRGNLSSGSFSVQINSSHESELAGKPTEPQDPRCQLRRQHLDIAPRYQGAPSSKNALTHSRSTRELTPETAFLADARSDLPANWGRTERNILQRWTLGD